MSDEKNVKKVVDFIAKNKSYIITLKPIKQQLAPNGTILLEDPGVDIAFSNKRYSTSDPSIIEALKANAMFGIDFWIEKEMSDEVKAKLAQQLKVGPTMHSGAMDSLDGATAQMDEERKKLDADKAAFAKEKAAFDDKNNGVDPAEDSLPTAEETGEPAGDTPAAPSAKPKAKAKAKAKGKNKK